MILPFSVSKAAVDLPDWWSDPDQLRQYTEALHSDKMMEKTIRTIAKQVYKEPNRGQLAEISATRQNFIRDLLAHMRGRQKHLESDQAAASTWRQGEDCNSEQLVLAAAAAQIPAVTSGATPRRRAAIRSTRNTPIIPIEPTPLDDNSGRSSAELSQLPHDVPFCLVNIEALKSSALEASSPLMVHSTSAARDQMGEDLKKAVDDDEGCEAMEQQCNAAAESPAAGAQSRKPKGPPRGLPLVPVIHPPSNHACESSNPCAAEVAKPGAKMTCTHCPTDLTHIPVLEDRLDSQEDEYQRNLRSDEEQELDQDLKKTAALKQTAAEVPPDDSTAKALASVKSPAVVETGRCGSSPGSSKPEQQAAVWTIHISKSTGKKYYHNAETEESTYDKPDGPVQDRCQKHPECPRGFLHRGRCTRTAVPQVL